MGYATAASHLSHRSRPRYIDPNAHLMSSAQTPWSGAQPVAIQHSKPFDGQEAAKRLHRRLNLTLLKKEIYSDDAALLALAAEVSPDRMQDLLAAGASAELAEHIEQTMGLPAGWLDCRRESLSSLETAMLRAGSRAQSKAKEEGQESHESQGMPASDARQHTQAPTQSEDEQAALFSPSLFPAMNKEPEQGSLAATPPTETSESSWQVWLQGIIKQHPRGTSSRIAQHMGRGPSELSGWLTQQRGMPARLHDALIDGCKAVLGEDTSEQLRARLSSQAPAGRSAEPDAAMIAERPICAPDTVLSVNHSLPHPLQTPAAPTVERRRRAEDKALEVERDLAALRTAEKLADFLAALGQRTKTH